MRKIIVSAAVAVAVGALSSCGAGTPEPQVRACATTSDPPVVKAEAECDANRPGVRWYYAPASVIDEDDAAVPEEELDGDWYDWKDQMDLDEGSKSKSKATTKKSAPKTKAASKTKR